LRPGRNPIDKISGIKSVVTLRETTAKHVIEEKSSDVRLADIELDDKDENEISDELLDEVYGKLDDTYDKAFKLKETKEDVKEREPYWIHKQLKKSKPLKHIAAEESAQPLSIIPHGVPLKRGFPPTDPVKSLMKGFPEIDEKKNLMKAEKPIAPKISGFSAAELSELSEENVKMTPRMINKNIEAALTIQMPKHTKLLYGGENQRFQRDPAAANTSVSQLFI
jgi:hypothetical protein